MADAFVSYSRSDKEFVSRLFGALEARGRDLWVDWDDIPPTADWQAQIKAGIEEANDLIFVISPDSITSEVCAIELGMAEQLNKRIVPLLVRDVESKDAPEAVRRHNWIFFDDPAKFDQSVVTLVEALDTDLEHVQVHTRLLVQAQRWEREGRNRSLLIRGSELSEAEAWLAAASTEERRPAPLPLQAEFVRASREATARRQRVTVAGISIGLVVAIALAIVALVQRSTAIDQRNAATARELDAQAQNQYDTDPELSVLLATEAAETDPGDETEEALRQALGRSRVVATYHSPTGQPANALFAPRGDVLLVADGDDMARIRDLGDPGPPIELEAPGLSHQIAWSGDGRAVATGGAQPTVWDARTGEEIVRLSLGAVNIGLDRHARHVVAIDRAGDGHVFSVPGGRELTTLRAPGPGFPSWFDLSSDADVVAASKQTVERPLRAEVFVWNGATGALLRRVTVRGTIHAIDLTGDGGTLGIAGVTDGDDPGIQVLRTDGDPVFSAPDASTAVAISGYHEARPSFVFASLPSLAEFVGGESGQDQPLVGHTDSINSTDFAIGYGRVATGSDDATARLWDPFDGRQVALLAGHRDAVGTVNYNRDGTLVATTSADGDTRVWATDRPAPERSHPHRRGAMEALDLDPAGTGRMLLAGPGADARIVDSETLRDEGPIPLPRDATALAAEWAPDGAIVVVGYIAGGESGASVAVAEPDRPGSPTRIRPDGGVASVATAAGGTVLTISSSGTLQAWDGASGESLRTYDADATGGDIAASDAGDLVATLSAAGEITVLDLDTGERVATIDGPRPRDQLGGPPVPGLAFDPSGRLLASYGADRAVRLWDVATGELVQTLKGGPSFFGAADFSPDGKLVAGGDANGVYVWDVDSGAVVHHLEHVNQGTWGTIFGAGTGVTPEFSRDGETLISVGDVRVSVWSTETGQRLFDDPVTSVGGLSDDGRTVYTADRARLGAYACNLCGNLDDLLAHARESVTRTLTDAERERFLHD